METTARSVGTENMMMSERANDTGCSATFSIRDIEHRCQRHEDNCHVTVDESHGYKVMWWTEPFEDDE